MAVCSFSAVLALDSISVKHSDSGFSLLVIPIAITSAALGVLVRLRRPANLVGWLLLADGVSLASLSLAWPYAYYGGVSHPGGLPGAGWAAGCWSQTGWPGLYVFLMAIAFVFPDGRLPSPRWRKVIVATVISYIGLELGFALHPGHFDAPLEHISKPTPSYPSSLESVWVPFYIGVLASLFAAFFAVRSRLRSARGTERLQVLWFAYAAMVDPDCPGGQHPRRGGRGGRGRCGDRHRHLRDADRDPGGGRDGILRYRLFDIGLAINRTLVYGTLTVCIVLAYLVVVSGLNALISQSGIAGVLAARPGGSRCAAPEAAPSEARGPLGYGDRSDPYAALTRLGERLQGTLAPSEVVQTVVDSVAEALRLRYTAIEFDRDGTVETAASHGERGSGGLRRLPLIYNGETVANLVVQVPPGRQLSAPDERLLDDLAQHAGPAVHAVRLNADLQLSRERLVTAREERRRLRRDLHDGLGPALAGMAMQLDAAKAKAGDTQVEAVLGELRSETQDAIADIRRVVYELRPPALDELGLIGALREQAARLGDGSGVIVTVEAPEDVPALPAAVEVAAYRIATEALTNVSRHAGAHRCSVEISLDGGLHVEVSDDGRGIGDGRAGVGLTSMRERAAELGGSFATEARPGGGTIVRARLPLEAP